MTEGEKEFIVKTIFGLETQQALVEMSCEPGGFRVQMYAEEAINLGQSLIEVAQASLTDAFLVGFLREKVGADDKSVMLVLQQFREWREKRVGLA
jgi:hypothetical protein